MLKIIAQYGKMKLPFEFPIEPLEIHVKHKFICKIEADISTPREAAPLSNPAMAIDKDTNHDEREARDETLPDTTALFLRREGALLLHFQPDVLSLRPTLLEF